MNTDINGVVWMPDVAPRPEYCEICGEIARCWDLRDPQAFHVYCEKHFGEALKR